MERVMAPAGSLRKISRGRSGAAQSRGSLSALRSTSRAGGCTRLIYRRGWAWSLPGRPLDDFGVAAGRPGGGAACGRCTMMTSADAKAFARIQHAGQVDKVGAPYVEHLERVAFAAEHRAQQARDLGLAVDPDAVVQAAWLHDVIEDTPVTADELRGAGYAAAVVEMVELLTKPPGRETYEERIAAIIQSGNLGAILIKLSDNEDNTDPAG